MSAVVRAEPAAIGAKARGGERLRDALNLGWSVAELRGRLRYGHSEPPGATGYRLPRELHALPLGDEHSLTELQVATRKAVTLLAARFRLDDLAGNGEQAELLMKRLAISLDHDLGAAKPPGQRADEYPTGSAVATRWDEVAELVYQWDEEIQDCFSVSAELLAAYQLGRGLSETFWALDSSVPPPAAGEQPRPSSWEFLLGQHRNKLLCGYVKLLEGALPAQSAPAITGPLDGWTALVASGEVRAHPDAPAALRSQLQVWRDVLLGSRNPASLAKRFGIRVGVRQFGRVIRAFSLEVFLGGLGIAALAVAGYYLGAGKGNGLAVLASVLGFFGVTSAGLLARAKTQAQELFDHLQNAFYSDVVSDNATVLPSGARR